MAQHMLLTHTIHTATLTRTIQKAPVMPEVISGIPTQENSICQPAHGVKKPLNTIGFTSTAEMMQLLKDVCRVRHAILNYDIFRFEFPFQTYSNYHFWQY